MLCTRIRQKYTRHSKCKASLERNIYLLLCWNFDLRCCPCSLESMHQNSTLVTLLYHNMLSWIKSMSRLYACNQEHITNPMYLSSSTHHLSFTAASRHSVSDAWHAFIASNSWCSFALACFQDGRSLVKHSMLRDHRYNKPLQMVHSASRGVEPAIWFWAWWSTWSDWLWQAKRCWITPIPNFHPDARAK